MTEKEKEKLIETSMKNLEISREEAIQMLADDEEDFETEEMKELAKKGKEVTKGMAGRKVDAYGKASKRERKADMQKRMLIEILSQTLENIGCEFEVTNIEREILFTAEGRKFKIVLSAPRK